MKKIFIFTIGLLGFFSQLGYAQSSGSITANAKTTATLASVCTISAQNVNFGQISLPVSAQTSTSSMSVQCTKGSTYTISLAYGGVYGTGSSGTFEASSCYGLQFPPPSCFYSYSNYYNYGKMSGAASGDSIAYSIQVPNNPSQVWNTGNYSYSSTGTGSNQSISIIANLVPSQTTNQFPTPDNYSDTVTATITY